MEDTSYDEMFTTCSMGQLQQAAVDAARSYEQKLAEHARAVARVSTLEHITAEAAAKARTLNAAAQEQGELVAAIGREWVRRVRAEGII